MMPAGLEARTHFLTHKFEKAFVRARYLDKVQEERAKAGERFKGASARVGAEEEGRDHTLGSHKVCGVFYENTAATLRDRFVSGKAAFQKMDRDGSGFLSFKELLLSLERVEVLQSKSTYKSIRRRRMLSCWRCTVMAAASVFVLLYS